MPGLRSLLAPIAIGAVYFLAASATVSLTRFEGGVAFVWVATAILAAYLRVTPMKRWPVALAACGLASAAATAMFGMGPLAALPLALANIAEAVIAVALLRRLDAAPGTLESLEWLGKFILAAGIAAPAASGVAGAGAAQMLLGRDFAANWVHWFLGHALGTITVMPVALLVMRGEIGRWRAAASRGRTLESVALVSLVATISIAVFAQSAMPLLFVPMLPIILAIFRIGRLGAAASIVVLTVVGGAFTLSGRGPISLIDDTLGARVLFLQFYLAATVLTVLPVAADLARRKELFRRLRESEARYRLVTDHSTDGILNIDIDGRIRFASPSVRQLGGYAPEALIGELALSLVDAGDHAIVTDAHLRALGDPEGTTIVEYRGILASGERRWFETHTRGVIDEAGRPVGVVSAVRDVSHRKGVEERLARAALTDPLTGLANRRAFDVELRRRIAAAAGGAAPGCVALFDIDHFKRVNDRFGHAVGDRVLERFAQIARGVVRENDLVARLGGEEFAVILPEAGIDQAQRVCERLRRAVAAAAVDAAGQAVRVTVSGGVARYAAGRSEKTVVAQADAALYIAKADGRDRLALAA